jgi:hypothetical protein
MYSCSKLFSWEEIDVRMNLLVGVVYAQLFKAVLLGRN